MGKRKEIILIQTEVDGEILISKMCTTCSKEKDLNDFSRAKNGLGGRSAKCRSCSSEYHKKYNKTNQTKNMVFTKNGKKHKKCLTCEEVKEVDNYYPKGRNSFVSNCKPCYLKDRRKGTGPKIIEIVQVDGEDAKECRNCGEIKQFKEFHLTKGKGIGGFRSWCKSCMSKSWSIKRSENKEAATESCRLWRLKNPHKQRESQRRWRVNNPEKEKVYQNNRKARRKALRDDLTTEQWELILTEFGNQCALTGTKEDVSMDHFIPLSIGKGGTYVGNVYPLASSINNSKHNRNPFEWFEKYAEYHGVKKHAWDNLLLYLADENGMSTEDFEMHVKAIFKEAL